MNSFLQELVDELSSESVNTDEQYSELLHYAVESSFNDVNRTLGFMQAITDNYDHHFSSGDESFENYQAYRQSTAVIFATSGMDIPVEIMVPSFESQSFDSYSTEAEEKKGNILQRAWAGFLEMLKRAWDFVSGKSKDTKAELTKAQTQVESAKKTVTKAAEAVKKGIPASKVPSAPASTSTSVNNNSSDKILYSLSDINLKAKFSGDFITGGKLDFKPIIDKAMASSGVTLSKKITGSIKPADIDGYITTSNKRLAGLTPPKEHELNADQILKAVNGIDSAKLNEMTKTIDKYLKNYDDLVEVAGSMVADAKKNDEASKTDGSKALLENMRKGQKLYGAIYADLYTAVAYLTTSSKTADMLSKRVASITG